MNIAELFVRVRGDTSDLTRKMSGAEKSIERFGKTAGKWLGVGLGIGIAGMVKSSIEAQNAMAQLEARIKSTGGAAGRTIQQLDANAQALQKITTFSDEAVKGAQSLLLTFKQIRGDEFDRATKATLDLATAMGTDLRSAALQLGKALEDPVRGMTALRRSGVSFSKEQEAVIKKLVETGKAAEAQNLILAEMETQFGGAAEAARNTLGGALLGLKNAFTDVLEVSGDASSGVVGAINRMADAMPRLRKSFEDAFTVWSEQIAMFKRDLVVLGGIVVTTFSLMMEAAGRWLRMMTLGGWGQTWIDEARRMRSEVMAAIKDAQSGITEGFRRGTPTQHLGLSSIPLSSRPAAAAGAPSLSPEAVKKQQDALWKTIEVQFKSAFDNLDQVIRAWSTQVAATLQSVSDRIAMRTAGVLGDFDPAKAATAGLVPGAPQKFGFEGGQLKLDPEAQAMVNELKQQRADALKNSQMMTGKSVSKLDEVKAAIFNQTNILSAATMALGDKILLGGGGAGSRTGAFIGGSLLGAIGIGGGPLGKAFGGIVGTMAGSLFGGLFDKGKKVDQATDSLERFRRELNRITAGLFNVPDAFKRAAWVDRFTDPTILTPRPPGGGGTGVLPPTGVPGGGTTLTFVGDVNINGVQTTSQLWNELVRFGESKVASGNGTGLLLAGA